MKKALWKPTGREKSQPKRSIINKKTLNVLRVFITIKIITCVVVCYQ